MVQIQRLPNFLIVKIAWIIKMITPVVQQNLSRLLLMFVEGEYARRERYKQGEETENDKKINKEKKQKDLLSSTLTTLINFINFV